jgi:hypothetical protein
VQWALSSQLRDMDDSTPNEIDVRSLTTHQVTPDGSVICLNIENAGGRPIALRLPSFCVEQLLMTLPHLLSKALQARYGDESLRIVFPLGNWRLEVAFVLSAPTIARMTSAMKDQASTGTTHPRH